MHKANTDMLWFVNILCKSVKATAVYFLTLCHKLSSESFSVSFSFFVIPPIPNLKDAIMVIIIFLLCPFYQSELQDGE